MKQNKRPVIFAVLVAAYIVIMLLPTPEGLTVQGKSALALMLVGAIAMTVEVLPVEMIGFLMVTLQAALGIATLPEAVSRFAQPVLFFGICSFMASIGFQTSGLDKRIVGALSRLAGSSPKKLLFVFMMGAGLASTVFADLLVVIVIAPLAIQALKANGCEPGKSNLGKCFMMGIPIAALIGGSGSPLGSIMNVIGQSMIEQMTGVYISFFTWSAVGLPIVLLTVPVAYKVLTLVFPIEIDTLDMETINKNAEVGPMTSKEKKFIILFAAMIILCSTEKFHGFGTPICASVIAALMLLFEVVTWDECKQMVSWPMMIALFGITSLGSTVYASGASDWISGIMANAIGDMGALPVLVIIGLFTIFIHLLVPVNQALIAILIPIAISISGLIGLSPVYLALIVTFCVHISILLPLDAVPLIIFPTGYYKMYEMFKPGLIISLIWLLIIVIVLNTIGIVVGLV